MVQNRSGSGRSTHVTRRQTLSGATIALAGSAFAAGAGSASARQATPAATSMTPEPKPYLFQNSEFDGQFLRALDGIRYGGADVGECFSTGRRIPDGDHDTWY